ncbi:MAG: hypothetical protein OXD33_03995, partial [Rhodobacteraceae bacterium]|nr:hypothetical protein [Paracoccaceae bacterium]
PPAPTSHPSKLCDLHSSCHLPRLLVPPFSTCNADKNTRPALKTQGNCQRALVSLPGGFNAIASPNQVFHSRTGFVSLVVIALS